MTAVSYYKKIPELIRGMHDGQTRDIVLTFQGPKQKLVWSIITICTSSVFVVLNNAN